MKMTPGPTRFACSRVDNIRSAFELFFPLETQETLVDMTNLEGKRVYGESWKEVDLKAYTGLLLLAGVYHNGLPQRGHNELVECKHRESHFSCYNVSASL